MKRKWKIVKIKPFFRWFDLWVGCYIDAKHFRAGDVDIYICLFPTIGFKLELQK